MKMAQAFITFHLAFVVIMMAAVIYSRQSSDIIITEQQASQIIKVIDWPVVLLADKYVEFKTRYNNSSPYRHLNHFALVIGSFQWLVIGSLIDEFWNWLGRRRKNL